jgi:hypothetical protein
MPARCDALVHAAVTVPPLYLCDRVNATAVDIDQCNAREVLVEPSQMCLRRFKA